MKPPRTLFLLLLCCFSLDAQQQWSLAECDKSAQKLRQLEQKISSGYSLKEAQQLSADQRLLEKQLDHYCHNPVTTAGKPPQMKRNSKTNKASDLLTVKAKGPQLYVSAVSVKAPYQGKKLQAWLEFYPEPKQCFGVRDSRQMVWCVEQRQQAKANFERQWQQKFAQSKPE